MIRALMRRLRLLRLQYREYALEAQVEHGEGLIRDHVNRLANVEHELAHVRREMMMLESPSVLIERATGGR